MRREWKHERGKENGGRGEGLRPGVKLFLKESMDIGEGVECEGRWGGHGKVMTRVWREEVAFKQGHRVDCREGEGRPRLAIAWVLGSEPFKAAQKWTPSAQSH